MTRLFARTLIAIGLAGVLLAVGRVAYISYGASPLAPVEYFSCPEGGPAHVRGCRYVDWGRTDLIRLPGPKAAGELGFCEACVKRETIRGKASAQSLLQARAGTQSHQ